MSSRLLLFAAMVLATALTAEEVPPIGQPAPKMEPGQRWVFTFSNFARDDSAKQVTELMQRAKKAGYNGILVSDVKFEKFQLQPPEVGARLKKFREACTAAGMKFIAAVCPFGYADQLLTNDPNLCEGMPVRNATFVVKDGKLVPIEETLKLKNPSFEEFKDNNPVGWDADSPGTVSFKEETVKSEGNASLRQENPKDNGRPNCRVAQRVKVQPWHYYHLSVNVKTENWGGKDMRLMAIGDPKNGVSELNWQPPPIKETMDWTRIHATFCSLNNTEVTIYMGSWGPKNGKIWWDDVQLEPGGFVNLIRRDSLPLTITSEDGKTTYEEGKDFSAVKDPKMLNDPAPAYFTIWHDAPVVTIPQGSSLKEGQKVLATYHFATAAGKTNNFNMCMAEPKVYEIVEKHIQWMKANGNPDMYLMAHDEIRIGGWDDSCTKSHKTPGQLLAENIKKCTQIIKNIDPGKPILAWNDMFDPFHNASKTASEFFLVKGSAPWSGSWEGLCSDVGVATWMAKPESQKFFEERGHQQLLCGYYDSDPKKIVDWLNNTKDSKNIVGVMYTTWVGNYSDIEKFIGYVNEWEAGKSK